MTEQTPANSSEDTPQPPLGLGRRGLAAAVSLLVGPGLGHLTLGRMQGFGLLLLTWSLLFALPWLGIPGIVALGLVWLGSAVEVLRPRTRAAVPPIAVAFATFFGLMSTTLVGNSLAPVRLSVADSSASPALRPGDWLFATHASFLSSTREPQRGDLVVAVDRSQEAPRPLFVRIAALGGDVVEFAGGRIGVNGELVPRTELGACLSELPADGCRLWEEDLGGRRIQVFDRAENEADAAARPACPAGLDVAEGCRVPAGRVFVLADNRIEGEDSREFGPLSVDDVLAYPRLIYFAPGDYSRIGLRLDR